MGPRSLSARSGTAAAATVSEHSAAPLQTSLSLLSGDPSHCGSWRRPSRTRRRAG